MLVVITICLVLITIALVFGSDAAKGFIGFILKSLLILGLLFIVIIFAYS